MHYLCRHEYVLVYTELTWMQNNRHPATAHLLPAVHCQAGAGNSKLEQENDEKDDHVLGARGQRNNHAKPHNFEITVASHVIGQLVRDLLTRRGKDTKKSMTWWWCIAPMSPTMEMSSRKTPTAMTPPMMWMLDTKPNPFPHAATPISSSPTSWRDERGRKLTRVSWGSAHLIT